MSVIVNFNVGPHSPFRTISRLRRTHEQEAADAITRFSGTITFVLLHIAWFGFWIIFNVVSSHPFDKFPFGLLTLIVSLEAIFLSTFVMLSQNREAARSDIRSEIDFETNVLSEVWLEAVADKLGIEVDKVHATARARIDQAKAEQSQAFGA
jgi:uncharacterized membrane protein